MGNQCLRYHSRLAELIAIKKGEQYAKTMSWIRSRISFAPLRSTLVCLRGSRTLRRIQWTSRTRTLTLKLQKGPFERCVFCLFFFLFFLSSGTDFKMPNFIFFKTSRHLVFFSFSLQKRCCLKILSFFNRNEM